MAITVYNAYWSRLVFLTFLVYPLYRIDMPNISLYIGISFSMSLSLSENLVTITNALCPVFCAKNLIQQKKLACSPFPCYIKGISRYSSNTFVATDCQFFIKTIIWLINLIIKSPKTVYTKLFLKKRYKDVEIWWNKLKYNFTSHMVGNLFKKDDRR